MQSVTSDRRSKTARLRFISTYRRMYPRAPYAIYALSLAVSISLWFIALRAPLWLDETVSYFQIKGGFSEIMVRAGWPSVPAYSYILWLWTKLMGTGEIALRILSILAMLVAVLLLYCAARDLFYRSGDKDAAAIGAVIFCLNPLVIFAAIDVRPYAFGALAINASIFLLVRLRHNNSNWLPALLGFSAASMPMALPLRSASQTQGSGSVRSPPISRRSAAAVSGRSEAFRRLDDVAECACIRLR